MTAQFPTALYSSDTTILNETLTQTEWSQVVYEVEAIEAELGPTPSGTALTVATFLTALSTGAGLTATGHGALGTAATHPFSGLTGTFTAAQHGALGTAATHPFSGLTGTFTAAQHGALTTAATHPFSGLTGTLLLTPAQHGVLASTAASHGMTAITGTITGAQHGFLGSEAGHSFLGLSSSIYATYALPTPSGGATRSFFGVTIPAGIFSAKPLWGFAANADSTLFPYSALGHCGYDYSSVGNSATTVYFIITRSDGGLFATTQMRFSILLGN
jgi:hypothetical protein